MTRPTHSFSWLRGVIRPAQLATGTPTPGYVVVTNGTTQVWTNPSTIGGGGGGGGGGGWITDGTAGTMLEPGRTYLTDQDGEASIYMPGDGDISIDGGSGIPGHPFPDVYVTAYGDVKFQARRIRDQTDVGFVLLNLGSDPTTPTPLPGQMYFDPYGAHGRVRVYDTSSGWYTLAPDKTYVHNQSVASATWDFFHNLEKYPAVTVVDTGGNEVIGTVNHVDPYHVQITFSAAFSGKAFCN